MRVTVKDIGARSAALTALALLAACGQGPSTASPPAATSEQATPAPAATQADGQREQPVAPTAAEINAAKPNTDVATTPRQPAPAGPTEDTVTAAVSAGITTRATDLKRAPRIDAENLTTIPVATRITVVERQGGWYRVRFDASEGWVRMLDVARNRDIGAAGTRELDTAIGIATGRSGADNVAATTGIRGFSEEQLGTAQPDLTALAHLDGFATSRAEAAAEARARGLVAHHVDYLPAPR